MNEEKVLTLSAKILTKEDQLISTIEKSLAFTSENSKEEAYVKTIDEILDEFINSIEDESKAKGFVICDKNEVYCDIAIKLMFSLRSVKEEVKLEIPVFVVKAEELAERSENVSSD